VECCQAARWHLLVLHCQGLCLSQLYVFVFILNPGWCNGATGYSGDLTGTGVSDWGCDEQTVFDRVALHTLVVNKLYL